jgi:hypothetical protein
VLGGLEQQKTRKHGIVRLIGTFSKSTFIRHAAVFVKAALRPIQSHSVQGLPFPRLLALKQTIPKIPIISLLTLLHLLGLLISDCF